MPAVRKAIWLVPLGLSFGLWAAHLSAGPQPQQSLEPAKPRPAVEVEVRYIDDSVMKLKLLDDKLELVTKHGVLLVAVADVRRIDFAPRIPADVAEKAVLTVAKLNHPDFQAREAATAELKGLRERAYPYALKAAKSDDPEIARRAGEVVKFIQAKVPGAYLESRDTDVVHTDDSRITGRLSAEVLRVSTFQFGDQQLKLADVRVLRTGPGGAPDDLIAAPAAPANLGAYQQQFGKELVFAVTGATPAANTNAAVWGTDTYTLDSQLGAAAVHAGLVRPGETAVVRVRIVASPAQFVATSRNGIGSTAYGNFPAGAFEFVRK